MLLKKAKWTPWTRPRRSKDAGRRPATGSYPQRPEYKKVAWYFCSTADTEISPVNYIPTPWDPSELVKFIQTGVFNLSI